MISQTDYKIRCWLLANEAEIRRRHYNIGQAYAYYRVSSMEPVREAVFRRAEKLARTMGDVTIWIRRKPVDNQLRLFDDRGGDSFSDERARRGAWQ